MSGSENIKAVVLAGDGEFGRCPIASHLPPAMWPIGSKPAIVHLLENLVAQGIRQIAVCSPDDKEDLRQIFENFHNPVVKFIAEELPVGTAGCLRDAAIDGEPKLLMVISACTACPPRIDAMIDLHRAGGAELTVVFNPPATNGRAEPEPANIYICEPQVLEHIPKEGYFDIKESLIPRMLRAGKSVHAAVLSARVGNFRSWQDYLNAISEYLETLPKMEANLKLSRRDKSHAIWKSPTASVDSDVRMYGRVIIMDNAQISGGAVIVGPAVIGRNVTVGKNTVVANSIIWDDAAIGDECRMQRCVVDCGTMVPHGLAVAQEALSGRAGGMVRDSQAVQYVAASLRRAAGAIEDKCRPILPDWACSGAANIKKWGWIGVVLAAFLWAYYPGLADLWKLWQQSDEYSSGVLVPFLALYVVWSRRSDIAQCDIRPSLWGARGLVVVEAVRLFGLFFMYGAAERLSIVLAIGPLVLLLFGWQMFRKLSPVILFLLLMLPWPNRVQSAIALPLQQWSTSSAVFCLELIGYDVVREGNIIHIGPASVAVAEACNGLRMITAFVIVSGLVVLLVNRGRWEKLIIFASSLPIALLCNTVRLTVTAIAFTVLNGQQWEKIFHDGGGYAMMPLALVLIVAELRLMAKLTTQPGREA